MAVQIFELDKVPEAQLLDVIKEASDDQADIVTAVRDDQNTFTVEQTFLDPAAGAAGAAGTITLQGKMSHFGGPDDHGVKADEGLALWDASDFSNAPPGIFLDSQPPGTTGLARRLNPAANYLACRWNYSVTPRDFLRKTLVTVTANGKSLTAQPVDWGPNIATGRIADLSPGLERALGLTTDQTCTVQIPTPAGTQSPTPGTGVAVGVNLKALDLTIFPPDMASRLIVMTTSNGQTYWVVNQTGTDEGGQSLVRHVGSNTEILVSDTTVFPVQVSDKISAAVAAELNKAAPALGSDTGNGQAPTGTEDVNAKVFAAASAFVGHITSDVPATDNGNLACAWAVNQVVRQALGKPINTINGGNNGLSTASMFTVLKAHHTQLPPGAMPAGAVVISPTVGSNHGHVGIVGGNPGGGAAGSTQIFSNSSRAGKFEQNYTIDKWTARYRGKGLQVLFFALNRDQFV